MERWQIDTAQLKRKYLEKTSESEKLAKKARRYISGGDSHDLSYHQMDEKSFSQWLGRSIRMKSLGTVEEPENLVAFLASGESRYITGHEIMIDVGNTIQEVKG